MDSTCIAEVQVVNLIIIRQLADEIVHVGWYNEVIKKISFTVLILFKVKLRHYQK